MLFKSRNASNSMIATEKSLNNDPGISVMALIDLMVLIDKGEFAFHTVIIESFRFKLHSPPGRHHGPLQQVHHLSGKEVVVRLGQG